jgi:hypothetical protein
MSETPNDELRLHETEAQMRHALGLCNTSLSQATPPLATPTASTSHPQRRRFVRDGEVPVSVIHRDQNDAFGANALETARQAVREQVAARERADHLLQEAQATIHDLQTKLAHERLGRDEAMQRAAGDRQVVEQALQSVQEELTVVRASRQKAEQERARAIAARQEAEERLLEMLATQDAQKASSLPTDYPAGGGNTAKQLIGVDDRRNPTSPRRSSWNGGSRVGGIGWGRTRANPIAVYDRVDSVGPSA